MQKALVDRPGGSRLPSVLGDGLCSNRDDLPQIPASVQRCKSLGTTPQVRCQTWHFLAQECAWSLAEGIFLRLSSAHFSSLGRFGNFCVYLSSAKLLLPSAVESHKARDAQEALRTSCLSTKTTEGRFKPDSGSGSFSSAEPLSLHASSLTCLPQFSCLYTSPGLP